MRKAVFVLLICELSLLLLMCVTEIASGRSKRSKTFDPKTFQSCFEDLGCIDTTEKWYHEKYRPRNLEPLDRHTIRTEFLLMKSAQNSSNELVYDVMTLKKESVEMAGFRPSTCTIFVIHDFTSNGYTGWIKHLVVAFTKKTECNLVSVDWQAGAEPPFEQAIANARVVALEARFFIRLLQNAFGQSPDNLHLIGHGVGAHIAGYVGKCVHGVQRITGLDPTGPLFELMPAEVRIDASDAQYVEILHTDHFNHRSQGGRVPLGHADFVINDAGHQPGCNDSSHMPSFLKLHRDDLREGHILPACSHKRAFKYYIQALEDDACRFIGLKCDSHHDYQTGACNAAACDKGTCATFGLEPPSVKTCNNTFYVVTNGKKPFCMVNYAVTITTAKGKGGKRDGYFDMILVDNDNRVTNATSNVFGTEVRRFESGHTYQFVYHALPPRLGRIKEAKVMWNYKSKTVCLMCTKTIAVHDIGVRQLTLKPDHPASVSWICPVKREVVMKTGDYIEFANCMDLYGSKYDADHVQPEKAHPSNCTTPGGSTAENEYTTATTNMVTSLVSKKSVKVRSWPKRTQVSASAAPASEATTSTITSAPTARAASVTNDEMVKEFKDCFDEVPSTTTPAQFCENMGDRNIRNSDGFEDT